MELNLLKEQHILLTTRPSLQLLWVVKLRKCVSTERYELCILTQEYFPKSHCQLVQPICITMLIFLAFSQHTTEKSTSPLLLILSVGNLILCSWQSTMTSQLWVPMAIYHSYHCRTELDISDLGLSFEKSAFFGPVIHSVLNWIFIADSILSLASFLVHPLDFFLFWPLSQTPNAFIFVLLLESGEPAVPLFLLRPLPCFYILFIKTLFSPKSTVPLFLPEALDARTFSSVAAFTVLSSYCVAGEIQAVVDGYPSSTTLKHTVCAVFSFLTTYNSSPNLGFVKLNPLLSHESTYLLQEFL